MPAEPCTISIEHAGALTFTECECKSESCPIRESEPIADPERAAFIAFAHALRAALTGG